MEKAMKPARLEARTTEEQKELILQASDLLGCTMTDFILNTLSRAAKQVIAEHNSAKLSLSQSKRFAEALLDESLVPNKKLKDAAEEFKILMRK